MKLNKKNKLLLLGAATMLFLSYQLALKNTFKAYANFLENKANREMVGNIPKKMALLSQKEHLLDKQLDELNIEDISIQNNLLKYLSSEAEKYQVKIIDFNSPHLINTQGGQKETFIFDLEGGYSSLLQTINALENNGSFGAVSHLHFEKMKDYRSKRTYLRTKIFLEQVK